MKVITRNVVGDEGKLYEGTIQQAENTGEFLAVLDANQFSLEDFNLAIRIVRKKMYVAALGESPDSVIENAYQALLKAGFKPEAARVTAGSMRSELGSGIPAGLKDLNRVSKRGRKSEAEKAEADKTEDAKSAPPVKPNLVKPGKSK